ncbi:hypothetical protein [Dactylosporangium salmoneum]
MNRKEGLPTSGEYDSPSMAVKSWSRANADSADVVSLNCTRMPEMLKK